MRMQLKTYIETRGRATELAMKVGVHVSTISRIANQQINPTAAMIARICSASAGEIEPSDFFAPSDQDA